MTNEQAVQVLQANWKKLPEKDHKFATDLLASHLKNQMTPKRWYWLVKLAGQASEDAPAPVEATTVEVGDFSGVIELFKTAKQHLKHPRIVLQLPKGQPLVLSVAGPTSKAPGTVNVTDGKPFGMNIWYGRVTPAGQWTPSLSQAVGDLIGPITELLSRLAKSPARVAAEFGKLTGYCCFCNTKLTDKRSTEVGYGPTCAEHYGMPYPKRAGLKSDAPKMVEQIADAHGGLHISGGLAVTHVSSADYGLGSPEIAAEIAKIDFAEAEKKMVASMIVIAREKFKEVQGLYPSLDILGQINLVAAHLNFSRNTVLEILSNRKESV